MVGHCTQYEQYPLIHLWYITTNIHLLNNGHKCYMLAQSQVYFTCLKLLLWLIIVPNMNKITNSSHITINTQNLWKLEIVIITQIWNGANAMLHVQTLLHVSAIHVHGYCSKYEQKQHNACNILEKMAIITQLWHRTQFCFTFISIPWHPMVPNMKKIQ